MKLGVFSDTHDHLPNIAAAVDIFLQKGVTKIVHCGDYVAPFVSRALAKLLDQKIEMVGVFGNNDGELDGLRNALGKFMQIKGQFAEVEWNGIKIAVYHGTSHPLLDNIIESGKYDLVLCGHTHQVRVEHINSTVVVNPGETCGYLTGKATCAIIDLDDRPLCLESVEILNITPKKE